MNVSVKFDHDIPSVLLAIKERARLDDPGFDITVKLEKLLVRCPNGDGIEIGQLEDGEIAVIHHTEVDGVGDVPEIVLSILNGES